jgi:aminopeptidase N
MRRRHLHLAAPVVIAGALASVVAVPAPIASASAWSAGLTCLHARLESSALRAAVAADDRFDPDTGRDLRNVPPDRLVDFDHMRLEIDIPDMNDPRASVVETLTFSAIGAPVGALTLNAEMLEIEAVERMGEGTVRWSHDGSALAVAFDPPLAPGVPGGLVIRYAFIDPVDGLTWTPEDPAWPGRPAQIHTQGQPDTNRYWFVSHDFPNDRMTTELVVTVPEGYTVSGNGRLVEETTADGRTAFAWLQDKAHVSYLVSLIVGKFAVVDVTDGDLPMPVYVPDMWADRVEPTYGNTAAMVRVFEERFDEPYPWDRYAQLVVWNFMAGGMENTSATTMYDTAVLDEIALEDADLDGLIAHELGHQWFGDLVTCNSWEHIWLNEGFATYTECLWFEERDGHDRGYLVDVYNNMRGLARRDAVNPDDADGWMRPGMVSNLYESPNDVFGRLSNAYPKGASTLHMLRAMLGDEVFFRGLQAYLDRYKQDTVETADFRQVMEEVSGRSLERFFAQWTERPGTPQTTIRAEWNEGAGELLLTVEQTQRIDAMLPAFAFTLPVTIVGADGRITEVALEVGERRHEQRVALAADPAMVVVDPNLHVLMHATVQQPAARWRAQLADGPTTPSRIDAAAALEGHPSDATRDALVATVADTEEFHQVRSRAATALGSLGEADALADLYEAGIDDARVRRGIVSGLAAARGDRALALLRQIAQDRGETYAVQGEALEGLGAIGDESDLPLLIAALGVESQHDQVRRSALAALADLGEPAALDDAIEYTRFGHLARTRPAAISAVATLAETDEQKARAAAALIPILRDREVRARSAAGAALARIGHESALDELRRLARSDRSESFRASCERWADAVAAGGRADEPVSRMRRDIEALEREVERLKEELGQR